MNMFQIIWGYANILSFITIVNWLIEFLFNFHTPQAVLYSVICLILVLIRILPLEDSDYLLGFRMELRNLGFR